MHIDDASSELPRSVDSFAERPAHAAGADAAIRAALSLNGIQERDHTKSIAEALDISIKQAQRKLRLGIWSLQDLLLLQARLDVTLTAILSTDNFAPGPQLIAEPANLLIDGESMQCEVVVGPVVTWHPQGQGLACTKHKGQWLVGTLPRLEMSAPGELRYVVESIRSLDSMRPMRIAVLDDDVPTADSLAEWFSEQGYAATAFNEPSELESAGIELYDAFVLDVVLRGGSCYSLVNRIREIDEDAAIVLLTGKARGNAPLENELAEFVQEHRLDVAVKPTPPRFLLAKILTSVSRRRSSPTN